MAKNNQVRQESLFTDQQTQFWNNLFQQLSGNFTESGVGQQIMQLLSQGPQDTSQQSAEIRRGGLEAGQEFRQELTEANLGGIFSSDFGKALGQGLGDIEQNVTTAQAQLQQGSFEQQQARLLSMLQMLSGGQQGQQQVLAGLLGIPQTENIGFQGQQEQGFDWMSLLTPLAAGGGGYLAAASDETLKADIEDGTQAIVDFLNELVPKKFRYSEENDGESRVGIMAQDLEKSALGKQLVINAKHGKMVDVTQSIGALLAGQGNMNQRLNKLEAVG